MMKKIHVIMSLMLVLAAMSSLVSCEKRGEEGGDEKLPSEFSEHGILSFTNPADGRDISANGETINCTLNSEAPYKAELVIADGGSDWAVVAKGEEGAAGRNTLRVNFEKNETEAVRKAELFVQVEGYDRVSVAVFSQGKSPAVKNMTLNTYMHEILLEEYLWRDAYKELEVDLSMDYTTFLHNHLTQLGDVNIEDGGWARSGSANAGERFIYTNIQEMASTTKSVETFSLGFGPFFSSEMPDGTTIGLSVSYVHQGSPADLAGMKRGDTIYKVNGKLLTGANYKSYMSELYYSPSGSYSFEFFRNADVGESWTAENVTAAAYIYNPVLFSGVMYDDELNPEHRIGYLVLENFDMNSQEFVVDIINQFVESEITDLILDLRFNPGGSVAQSRYLSSAIAGYSHLDDTFVKVTFVDGSSQDWKFRGGPEDQDGLGIAPDLGLERLFVIGSSNTASASELVINSLRGIDFPVTLYGGRTEGKNVGMTTTQTKYEGRTYLFSPITFYVENAKGFRDYPDGFDADVVVNNQNDNYSDDEDNLFPYSFGDWGNLDFNVALRFAYEDIIGTSVALRSASVPGFRPLDACPLGNLRYGRYGNVIYRNDEL